MRSLDEIRAGLHAHVPRELTGRRRAAVAVALHDASDGPEALFIERAERFGDPWSGQMAFPGGRVDPGDSGPRAAAERETLEEVGVDLSGAELLGRLGDIDAGVRIKNIESNTHRIDVKRPTANQAQVRLSPSDSIPNKDFVLRYTVAGDAVETALVTHKDARGGISR